MASGYVQVPADSVGKKVDCVSLSAGGSSVVRQTIVIADPTSSAGFATVTGGKLNVNASVGGTVTVSGQVSVTGSVAISNTVTVQGNVSATIIGSLPNINVSAMPAVVLAAGAANIGTLNGISATILASITNRISIDSISGIVTVVGQTPPGSSGASSWPVMMGGIDGSNLIRTLRTNANGELTVNVSSMPAISIGPISTIDKISATVVAAITSSINLNISAMPNVVLAAGATLDGISKTVNVVVTNAINISSMPAISIGPISTIDKISSTVLCAITSAININISSMPSITVSVGPITTLDRISATVTVAGTVLLGGAIAGKVNVLTAAGDFVFVSGPVAPGSAGTGYFPVHVGGLDNGGTARTMKLDASGNVQVVVASGAIDISSMPKVTISGSVLCAVTGTVNISGSVLAAVTGTVNISGTPSVVLAAGTANIGTINNISAAVVVSGNVTVDKVSAAVVLAAGTANIGTINNISAAVTVSGNVTVDKVSAAVVLAAGTANIGSINNISAAVVLAAGAANIGSINGISATVNVAITANTSRPMAVASASHGPKTSSLSASASVALIAAPGAATSIYVTEILATNGSPTLTQLQIYEASATATPNPCQYLAANGGGFSVKFDPPWKVSANTALNARLKPSVSAGLVLVTINFYTGA